MIVFFGNMVGENQRLPKGLSHAGNKFQNRLVEVLDPYVYSIVYDDCLSCNLGKVKGQLIEVYSIRTLFAAVVKSLRLEKRRIRNSDYVLYNLDWFNLIILVGLKLFRAKKVILIIADWSETGIKRACQRGVVNYLEPYVVALRALSDVSVQRVLPGVWSEMPFVDFNIKSKRSILLSGSIGLTTGLYRIIQLFESRSELKPIELNICGVFYKMTEKDERMILARMERLDNVKFHGDLGNSEYQSLLNKCSIGLSLRDVHDKQHETNFPSKILEYLLHGMHVISSLCYESLNSKDLHVCSDNDNLLLELILKLSETDVQTVDRSHVLEQCDISFLV